MKTTAKLSFTGLNAANFFQAEMAGVILPVLKALLSGLDHLSPESRQSAAPRIDGS
jgi:hypothetical protein